jgi:hypothetical protein
VSSGVVAVRRYKIGLDLADDEVQQYANDFRGLIDLPEWAAFCALVASHEDKAAYEGHFSDEQPAGYWRGYLSALRELRETPRALVDAADAVNREMTRQSELSERLRLKQPIPAALLEPMDDGARILRGHFGGEEDE